MKKLLYNLQYAALNLKLQCGSRHCARAQQWLHCGNTACVACNTTRQAQCACELSTLALQHSANDTKLLLEDLQALHSFLAHQSAATAQEAKRRNSLWCGKRLQLQQLQQQSQALNGGKQNGGNFHSTYAPWPATAPQQQQRQEDRDGRTINLML